MTKGSTLSGVSIEEIQQELRRRAKGIPALMKKRARLMSKVATIDAKIVSLGGVVASSSKGRTGGAVGRPRGPRKGPVGRGRRAPGESLVAYIKKVLDGKTMGVPEIITAVKAMGYASTSPNFRTIVNAQLINKKNGFKRVSRGQYTNG